MVRLKASSLIEVIVAMVILSLSILIGGMIYLNVIRSSASTQEIEAAIFLQSLAKKLENEQKFINQVFQEERFSVNASFSPYQGNQSLILMELEAVNTENKRITFLQKLVLIK